MKLAGKTAVVTGASSGIGRALAMELARAGCRLVLTGLESDLLDEAARDVADTGATAVVRAADFADPAARADIVAWVVQHAPVDLLIHCAGIGGRFGAFAASNPDDVERVLSVNLRAMLDLTRALLPTLRQRPRAMIVNVSSGIAHLPYPGLAVYGATKAFVSSFSASLACELSGSGVRVLCFHPGFTATPFMQRSAMDMRRVPRFMIHEPRQVAAAILRAVRRDRTFAWSDALTALADRLVPLLPQGLQTRLFHNLFWEVGHDR